MVCIALFLAVFIGKGVHPEEIRDTSQQLLSVIRLNTDFKGAFQRLGQAMSEQDSTPLEEFGAFCAAVFGTQVEQEHTEQKLDPGSAAEASGSASEQRIEEMQPLPSNSNESELPKESEKSFTVSEDEAAVESVPKQLKVGEVVQAVAYDGEPMPEHYTMQWLYLGEMESVTPVTGTISSDFGYRDHPTMNRHTIHGGVDIAAKEGSAVAAFAAGTVEYIGESDDFGLYLQIIHENGVKTFYAHCSKLCVKKGQRVSAGETVALVGSTGESTGSHLHFEIKYGGQRLNPEYYIDVSGGN